MKVYYILRNIPLEGIKLEELKIKFNNIFFDDNLKILFKNNLVIKKDDLWLLNLELNKNELNLLENKYKYQENRSKSINNFWIDNNIILELYIVKLAKEHKKIDLNLLYSKIKEKYTFKEDFIKEQIDKLIEREYIKLVQNVIYYLA